MEQLSNTQDFLDLKSWLHNPRGIPSIPTFMTDLKISKWKSWDGTQPLDPLEYSISVRAFGANL